jgi:hypothetical protein
MAWRVRIARAALHHQPAQILSLLMMILLALKAFHLQRKWAIIATKTTAHGATSLNLRQCHPRRLLTQPAMASQSDDVASQRLIYSL